MKIEAYSHSDITVELATAIIRLTNVIWPSKDKTEQELIKKVQEHSSRYYVHPNPRLTRFVIWEGPGESKAICHAMVFLRTIKFGGQEMEVLALAGVCTSPEHRGKAYGTAIVKAAFAKLEEWDIAVCLFQTGVEDFYKQLGAVEVTNKFVNRRDEESPDQNPFWDNAAMIYPASANWPSGEIDLNGKGY